MKDLFSKPNQITFIRILLIPVFVMFLLMDLPYKNYIAAFIFIILSLSDALDGYIARKKKQITNIGKIIDPIADKLLIAAALIFLIGRIQLWMAVVIIVRELVITGLRLFFLPKKVVISASYLGKIKTFSQIIAIIAVILNAPFNWWLMLIAVIITVVSGFDYIIKMGKLMGEDVLNIPNLITTFRLFLIPLYLINLINLNLNFALIIFTVIVLLDKLDGISARMTEQVTKFGRVYDAYTDTIVLISSSVVFYMIDLLSLFWIITFIMTALVLLSLNVNYYLKTKEVPSSTLGKILMGLSYVAVVSIIINFIFTFHVLVLIVMLASAYIVFIVYKTLTIRKSKSF